MNKKILSIVFMTLVIGIAMTSLGTTQTFSEEVDDDWWWAGDIEIITEPIHHLGDVGIGSSSTGMFSGHGADRFLTLLGTNTASLELVGRRTSGGIGKIDFGYINPNVIPINPIQIATISGMRRTGDLGELRFFINDGDDLQEIMTIKDGNVGIGHTNPQYPLHVKSLPGEGILVEADGRNTQIQLEVADDDYGFLDLGGGTNIRGGGRTSEFSGSIRLAGGSDIAEPFDIQENDQVEPGMVVCIDSENPGDLKVTNKAYDRCVAGVISGAGGVKPGLILNQDDIFSGEHQVALAGRVYGYCDASYGSIQPGDLLTTSPTIGHAMKVTNYEKAQGAIIGKAMTRLDEGMDLVLILVNLQ